MGEKKIYRDAIFCPMNRELCQNLSRYLVWENLREENLSKLRNFCSELFICNFDKLPMIYMSYPFVPLPNEIKFSMATH